MAPPASLFLQTHLWSCIRLPFIFFLSFHDQVNFILMEADWRSQLDPTMRNRVIIKIMDSLKRYLPISCDGGLDELYKIATRFEGKIYDCSTSQTDYLRKISLKMLSMEPKRPSAVSVISSDETRYDTNSVVSINGSSKLCKRPKSEADSSIVNRQVQGVDEGVSSTKKIKVSGQKIQPTFSCPICMNTMESLWSTICGHIFFEACIKYALVRQKQCPTCREILFMENCIHKIYLPNAD